MPLTRDLTPYSRKTGQAGVYAPSATFIHNGIASGALTAGRTYVARFYLDEPMTVDKIKVQITTLGGNDAVDAGIYDAALTTKIVAAGSTTGILNGTGWKTIALAATPLAAGLSYYVALAMPSSFTGVTPACLQLASPAAAASEGFGATAGLREHGFVAQAATLPSSLTVTTGGACPLFVVGAA